MGLSCPKKLEFALRPDYHNPSHEDSFLGSLADGGFQVGQFAKAHFPDGEEVSCRDHAEALMRTSKLLERDSVTIFEAAIEFRTCFIRIDVLEKSGNLLRIHEVKAKSWDPAAGESFTSARGTLMSKWRENLYDVAFQKWVVMSAFPESNVTANLMLINKSSMCSQDGLHQNYRVFHGDEGRRAIEVSVPSARLIADQLLLSVPADLECDAIYNAHEHGSRFSGSFNELVTHLSHICDGTTAPATQIQGNCGNCEFRAVADGTSTGPNWAECLNVAFGISNPDPGTLIFDLWDWRRKDEYLNQGVIYLHQMSDEDFEDVEQPTPGNGLERRQRQRIQVEKAKAGDTKPWLDSVGWEDEIAEWRYPLHFIDFETTRVALPFFKDTAPYQTVAFQFSHHILDEAGSLRHANQFLLASPLKNPNVEFVRHLARALSSDYGTIFMYSHHENTTLRDIYFELGTLAHQISDGEELRDFLRSLVRPSGDMANAWVPTRPMVDQCQLVKRFLYLPDTHGSNSLKAVLPAILNASKRVQSVYSDPIYGFEANIPSLNYAQQTWIQFDRTGKVRNPYDLLPALSDGLTSSEQEELRYLNKIQDGGAALTAYARLMQEDLSDQHRRAIETGLKKYCELDTLAMVFLYQGVLDLLAET